MNSIPGSLSFAKMVMMSSAPAKSKEDARYASQDPLIRLMSQTISTPNAVRSAFFLRRTQQHNNITLFKEGAVITCYSFPNLRPSK